MKFSKEVLSFEEQKELTEAAKLRFSKKEINEGEFRMILAKLGFNATEISAEVDLVNKGWL